MTTKKKESRKTITVDGKDINLRIYTRNIAAMNSKLGMNLQQAVMEVYDNPALLAPVLWACMVGKKSEDLPTIEDAQDVVDDLIDQGNDPEELMELAIDIGVNSGFFTGSRAVQLKRIPEMMTQVTATADQKMVEKMDKIITKQTAKK